MKVLDLFAGLRGWSDPWRWSGHQTFTIDLDSRFRVDAYLDIRDVAGVIRALPWKPDVILASPPCAGFTTMNIGKNWYHDGRPKTFTAVMALSLVEATLDLIWRLNPKWFVIENPVAMLRSLPLLDHLERRTVTYCKLGEARMKPTDLWGGFPPSLVLPEPCRPGDKCHQPTPAGTRLPGSTQGIGSSRDRAKIPRALSLLVMRAAEQDF